MTEEQVRKIVAEEIVKNLEFKFDNSSTDKCLELTIHITYDDHQLAYESL